MKKPAPPSSVRYLVAFASASMAAAMMAAPQFESSVGLRAEALRKGAQPFTDRGYEMEPPPSELEGAVFIQSSITGVDIICTQPGLTYALTPMADGDKAPSQEAALVAMGFKKSPISAFQLFGDNPINKVEVFEKNITQGERLTLGKWAILAGPAGTSVKKGSAIATHAVTAWQDNDGEQLYNGIRLPKIWPPRGGNSADRSVRKIPYLEHRPSVVPIDIGRQMLFDDFLVETSSLERVFHQPVKYEGNPILKPETDLEKQPGFCATAVPFSDGCFYDPADKTFKLWYMAGWCDGVALASSEDGLHWNRPTFDVVPGSNRVIAPKDNMRRDGVSVWLDYDTANPSERYKMFHYARNGNIGEKLAAGSGYLLTSPDGIHWDWKGKTGPSRDNTTMFYNPFRKVWVFSHRSRSADAAKSRDRSYWENKDFLAALDGWDDYEPVFWIGADDLDLPDPKIKDPTQLYKVDATPYESFMLGLIEIHYGPQNGACAKGGYPKLTDLQVAFSRDGFHWDRPTRTPFLAATQKEGSWERAYLSSVGGLCVVVGDKLYFYYGAFEGDPGRKASVELWSGMYANASTGVAILRRDGFASLRGNVQGGTLTTRPVTFTGRNLFVNVDCPKGGLRAEILAEDGTVIEPFSLANSESVSTDSTIQMMRWKGGGDLSALVGKPVRFRFHLTSGDLYSFWVSPDESGASRGYVAGGGPGFTGPIDTVGTAAYLAKP